MLTQREVVPYLLRHRLISPESIVEGDLVVKDASRLNRNFKVISGRGPSYLIKQGIGSSGIKTVSHEADVYKFIQSTTGMGRLDRYLPRFYGYDTENNVLILELLRDAQDLREYHIHRGRFSINLATAMGNALGTLHRLTWIGGIGTRRSRVSHVSHHGYSHFTVPILEFFGISAVRKFRLSRLFSNFHGSANFLIGSSKNGSLKR